MLHKDDIEHFSTRGYLIVPDIVTESELSELRSECDNLVNSLISQGVDLVEDLGCIVEPLNLSKAYCDSTVSGGSAEMLTTVESYLERRCEECDIGDEGASNRAEFIGRDVCLTRLGNIAKQLLPASATSVLINEQYIVKPPHTAEKECGFRWHYDAEYLNDDDLSANVLMLAIWLALDNVDETNGTISIKPFNSQHVTSIKMNAGGAVIMNGRLMHRSSGNESRQFRRCFMPQYAASPLHSTKTDTLLGHAIPLVNK